jgi:hypothetical protein
VIPDFSKVRNEKEILPIFVEAAKSIMLDHELRTREATFSITALELYLFMVGGEWQDTATHQRCNQLKPGRWYVHTTRRHNFRSAQWSGIDITAGVVDRAAGVEIYAGMLVRELGCCDGPAKALQSIVRGGYDSSRRRWSEEEKVFLGEIQGKSIFEGPLALKRRPDKVEEKPLWVGPRKLPNKNLEQRFRGAMLRLATWRTKLHSEKMVLVDEYLNR